MSQSITVPIGTRIKPSATEAYITTIAVETEGRPVKVSVQKNRHALLGCQNPTCLTHQREVNHGKALWPRDMKLKWEKSGFPLPNCGFCGTQWSFAGEGVGMKESDIPVGEPSGADETLGGGADSVE